MASLKAALVYFVPLPIAMTLALALDSVITRAADRYHLFRLDSLILPVSTLPAFVVGTLSYLVLSSSRYAARIRGTGIAAYCVTTSSLWIAFLVFLVAIVRPTMLPFRDEFGFVGLLFLCLMSVALGALVGDAIARLRSSPTA